MSFDGERVPLPGDIYLCSLEGAAEYDATGGTVATLNFTATGSGLTGNGPWTAVHDVAHAVADTSAGAKGGVKIYVMNAGYGPSAPERDLTDADDGQVAIRGIAQFNGYVDLQGRPNDAGATVEVYNQATRAGSVKLATATSAAGGAYTTSYEGTNLLTIGTTYWLQVDAPGYLPTTVLYSTGATDWANSKVLTTRALTTLANLKLLGGDANDDNKVDITDVGMIGGDYGLTSGFTSGSDVNVDGQVDILDLVLAAGNYDLDSSPWMP